MTDHPGFSLSVVLRYFVLPILFLAALTIWGTRMAPDRRLRLTRPDLICWALMTLFWVAYGLMGTLAYLNYRTTIEDLGVYDQRVWLLASSPGFPTPDRIVSTLGHFSPLLAIHVLLYEIYPSALVLVWTQTLAIGLGAYPVYQLAKRRLGAEPALIIAAAYLLYPSVVFAVRFDFHPDHLLVPLLLLAFDLLDRGRGWSLALVAACMLLVKESLIPTVSAFGAYAVLVQRRYLLGTLLLVVGAAAFVLVVVPHYAGVFTEGASGSQSYGYLGSDLPEILRTIVLSPGSWGTELARVAKLKFLFLMLAPLAMLPLFGPLALLVAVPGLLMSLLSQHPHRYQIWAQYTAPIIAPLVVAAIVGLHRLAASPLLARLVSRRAPTAVLLLWLLGASVYFNVMFSPSPLSTVFWLGTPPQLRWAYHWRAYRVTDRERSMRAALVRHVPSDPRVSVSSQNSLNSSHLVHRFDLRPFPTDADFIVVDLRRPLFIHDTIDPVAFHRSFEAIRAGRTILYESDGFYVFGAPLAPPAPPS